MLHRPFDPTVIYAAFSHKKFGTFADWEAAAQTATDHLVDWTATHPVKQKGDSLPVDSEMYGALKESLKRYFEGKCAYCESDFETVSWGDVEHYRPKRGVTGEEQHVGYYWLSYAASNLMPSCQMCNQGKGKRNQFPIGGTRAYNKTDNIAAESPLLLNPYMEDDCAPATHFDYVVEQQGWEVLPTGRIEGLTPRGIRSIDVYDLNRSALVRRRFKNQIAAVKALRLAVISTEALRQQWKELFALEQEHAAAVRAACRRWMKAYQDELNAATIP